MTLTQYLFEAGPDGGAITNGNSGSTASSVTAGGTTLYSTAKAAHGSFGYKATNAAAGQAFRRYPFAAATTAFRFSGVVTLPSSFPASNLPLGSFVNASGTARLRFYISSTGQLGIFDSASTATVVIASGLLTAGSKYRIAISVTAGSSTAGAITMKVYSGTTTWTAQVGTTFTKSDLNLNTDSIIAFDAGITSNHTESVEVGWDDLQLDDTAGSDIPDFVTPLETPVLTVTHTDVTTVGGSDGTIEVSWPAVSGADHYEFALVSGTVTSGFVATDSNAVSPKIVTGLASDTYTVAVRAMGS